MSSEPRMFQLHVSEEAMEMLEYCCDPKIDLRFEATPSVLAAVWIARWSHAPMTPGLAFLEREPFRPLVVTLRGAPLAEIAIYAKKMKQPPAIVAAAVVSARGAQVAWFRRNASFGKGMPEAPPPHAGA